MDKLNAVNVHNQKCQEADTEIVITKAELSANEKNIDAAQAAIEGWTKKLSSLQQIKSRLEAKLQQPLPLKYDSAEVEAELKSLSATNEAIRRNEQQRQANMVVDKCLLKYTQLGDEIKIVENQKAKKLAEAVMPVKGLTILSDGLAYNGIPLEQVNTAKKLEICVAISMAMNPKLKVLRINGNDLDTESLLTIGKIVDNQDYQIWIEKVSDDNKIGFYIEDGQLVGDKNELVS